MSTHDHAEKYLNLYMDIPRMKCSYLIAINSGKNPVEFADYVAELHVITINQLASDYPDVVSIYFGCSDDISDELEHGDYEVKYNIENVDTCGNVSILFTLSCNDREYTIKRNLN